MSRKVALIIANTEYSDSGLAQLTAPGQVIEDLADILRDPAFCAFDGVNVLWDQPEQVVRGAIDDLFEQKKPDDLILLYFSGHSVQDQQGGLYLAVKDTILNNLSLTAIKSDHIRKAMDQSHSRRQIMILDCSNSGGVAATFDGMRKGCVVLAADDSNRPTGEPASLLFTNTLIKGLRGEADTDGDGRITLDELYNYAREQVLTITGDQRPGKWPTKQQEEIVLCEHIQIEDTQLFPLPADLVAAISSSLPYLRESAISQLDLLLKAKNLRLARAARLALEKIAEEDDNLRVAQAAEKILERSQKTQQKWQKPEAVPPVSSTQFAQRRREKRKQEALVGGEESPGEKIEASRIAKESNRPFPATSSSRLLGIAVAILLLLLGLGFAAVRSLSAAPESIPPATSTIPPQQTELPAALVTARDTTTPTEKASQPIETTTMTVPAAAKELTDSKGVEVILIPAGTFQMGGADPDAKPDEKPVHPVTLDAYYIDKYEVTNAQYQACVDAGVCVQPKHTYFFFNLPRQIYYGNVEYDNYPVVFVNWNMAKAYCEWRDARLPTEAEWEKAARGDKDRRMYPWPGNDRTCQEVNFQECVNRTSEVGSLPDGRSPFGTYDMSGNVWEWVADWYSGNYYKTSVEQNPQGPDTGQSRVLRGGSWAKFDVRLSNRASLAPYSNTFDIGFRCASSTS